MVLYATFNNFSVISWRSVLLVEETGVPGENPRPSASHRQTLYEFDDVSELVCKYLVTRSSDKSNANI